MIPARIDIGPTDLDLARGLLPVILDALRRLPNGDLVAFTATRDLHDDLERWAQLTGHALVESAAVEGRRARYVIRKGPASDPEADDRGLGARLWLYANFDCNLACDYCCVRSSPAAAKRRLEVGLVERIAAEAAELGFRRIFVTGGEPFLHPEIDRLLGSCASALPTTVLTNAMLFQGSRRAALERLDRARITLQVSLDSPAPALHDEHRGPGSWARAREGIQLARSLGFRVRVAATAATEKELEPMRAFLDQEGVSGEDRVLRTHARRGRAASGVVLTRKDLAPELTVTAAGVYWHPVGADDDDLLVTRELVPLRAALERTRQLEAEDRRVEERFKEVFVCA